MNTYCQLHTEEITDFCIESNCASRCLCKKCLHPHSFVPIVGLVENTFIKRTLTTFSIFKALINKMLFSIEEDLNKQLLKIPYEKPPKEITELTAFLGKKLQMKVLLRDQIETKLQRVIDALKPQPIQIQSLVKLPKTLESLPSIRNIEKQAPKMSTPFQNVKSDANLMDGQEENLQQDLMLDKLVVSRLHKFNQDDWPWKMEAEAIFLTIFTPIRDCKLLGFLQPMLYKSEKINYQKKSIQYNFAIYNKKNLIKAPLYKESQILRHRDLVVDDRCYNIMLKKELQLKTGKEYSIAVWSSSGFHCHYYSLVAPPNNFIKFQQQDFNDHPKIKRNEGVPQIISTFRAGLIPALIIDPREQD